MLCRPFDGQIAVIGELMARQAVGGGERASRVATGGHFGVLGDYGVPIVMDRSMSLTMSRCYSLMRAILSLMLGVALALQAGALCSAAQASGSGPAVLFASLPDRHAQGINPERLSAAFHA